MLSDGGGAKESVVDWSLLCEGVLSLVVALGGVLGVYVFVHVTRILGLLLLILPLALASRSVLPTSLIAGLRVFLEVVDEFAVSIGMGGLAVGIEVYEARHVAVLFVGLGNAERRQVGFTSSQLVAACSPS